MYDAGKILAGLVIFLALATTPVWWNAAAGAEVRAPKLVLPEGQTACVLPTAEMKATHMELLNRWRNEVVRRGERTMTTWDGRRERRSLTKGCLGCHTDKASFCDRCHNYVAVSPYCWDCHVVPKGGAS